MTIDEVVDWVKVGVEGCGNMIFITLQKCQGKCVRFVGIFGLSRVLKGVHGSWMYGLDFLDMVLEELADWVWVRI